MDYSGIEALYTVILLQSFERAAKKLHITQSAISQRIKSLETSFGEPLLIRTLPYKATKLGKKLIGHYKRISLLEEEFANEITCKMQAHPLAIAINRDSLETWFLDLLSTLELFSDVSLEIIADDQERTLNYLKNGQVSAALSTSKKEIQGGKCIFLGNMTYTMVASPAFIKKFSPQKSVNNLLKAPALKFDSNDNLHERYLERFFDINDFDINYHVMPSVDGFRKLALLGYAYGLVPKIDIKEDLKRKRLIELFPNKIWEVPLYWHTFSTLSPFYEKFHRNFIFHVKKILESV